MTARRAIVGLCAVCALFVSALAAQGASAAIAGTTSFTCQGSGGTLGADCITGTTGSSKAVAIAEGTKTELGGHNVGETKLKAKVAGANVVLTATVVGPATGENWVKNTKSGSEHLIEGEGKITYSNVKATSGAPNCTVVGLTSPGGTEMISTTQLKATTSGITAHAGIANPAMALKFVPATGAGTLFAEFELTGASCAFAGTKFPITGSVVGTPNGAQTEFGHTATTEQETLKLGANNAGIEGTLTFEGRPITVPPSGAYTPIAAQTVET